MKEISDIGCASLAANNRVGVLFTKLLLLPWFVNGTYYEIEQKILLTYYVKENFIKPFISKNLWHNFILKSGKSKKLNE